MQTWTLTASGNTLPWTVLMLRIDGLKSFKAFEKLGGTPSMGHKRDDLTKYPLLFWPVGSYLIIYRSDHTPIEIVAVTRGSRDIPAFLHRRI